LAKFLRVETATHKVFAHATTTTTFPKKLTRAVLSEGLETGTIPMGDDVMTFAKVLFVVGGVAVLGMLGAEKLRAQPSPVDCDRYAQEYARNHSRNGQVIRGAGGGALLGAGIGALAGGAGTGAAIGAGVGALTGGARRSRHASRIYNHAYHECMAGRAHW
jgi:hypothetical protein